MNFMEQVNLFRSKCTYLIVVISLKTDIMLFEIYILIINNDFIIILLLDHVSLTTDEISSSGGGDDMDTTNQGQVGKHRLVT